MNIKQLEELYKLHYRTVYSYAAHFVNDHSSRLDIVHDVFAYLIENKETLQFNKSAKSYLLSACHNTCLNYIKKQKVRQRYVSEILDEDSNFVNGYDTVFEQELRNKIETILSELPKQCRLIFELSRLKGMKHKEIADILDISPKTVETQIYRALKTFKKVLKTDILIFIYIFLEML